MDKLNKIAGKRKLLRSFAHEPSSDRNIQPWLPRDLFVFFLFCSYALISFFEDCIPCRTLQNYFERAVCSVCSQRSSRERSATDWSESVAARRRRVARLRDVRGLIHTGRHDCLLCLPLKWSRCRTCHRCHRDSIDWCAMQSDVSKSTIPARHTPSWRTGGSYQRMHLDVVYTVGHPRGRREKCDLNRFRASWESFFKNWDWRWQSAFLKCFGKHCYLWKKIYIVMCFKLVKREKIIELYSVL